MKYDLHIGDILATKETEPTTIVDIGSIFVFSEYYDSTEGCNKDYKQLIVDVEKDISAGKTRVFREVPIVAITIMEEEEPKQNKPYKNYI